jgi:transcriptional regulator with XRE-family HTH domain
MPAKDAGAFWSRYKRLVKKDLPVLLKTGILQPTLSSWRTKKIFPRANEAAAIASALNTTVEYLVSGKDTRNTTVSPSALNIAITADNLSEDGLKILASVADSLALKFPASRKKS